MEKVPCRSACPIGNDIPGVITRMREGDYDGALEVFLLTSPFPSICGRVCPAFCEKACNRGRLVESVAVRALERFLADRVERSSTKHEA